jgi:hypothetical protein
MDAQPTVTQNAATEPTSMADQYFLPLSVGMIVLMIVILAVLAMVLLRRKP